MNLGADKGESARLFDDFRQTLYPLLGFTSSYEITKSANDFSRPEGLFRGAVQTVLNSGAAWT